MCAHPVVVVHGADKHYVPCRKCLPCLQSYVRQISFAAQAELLTCYKRGQGATFVTLTYDDDHLPENGSLSKRELQLFNKSIRSKLDYKKINLKYKYILCGEYGDKFGRAHYHGVFLGLDDLLFRTLAKDVWIKGLTDIQPLKGGGIRYVLKYALKRLNHPFGIDFLEPPFLLRSVKMGYDWIAENIKSITDNNFQYYAMGQLYPLPKYYRDMLDKYKNYDTLSSVKRLADEADRRGLSLHDYCMAQSLAKEKYLIQECRSNGVPVDDFEYILESSSVGLPLDRMVEDIIDPLPF